MNRKVAVVLGALAFAAALVLGTLFEGSTIGSSAVSVWWLPIIAFAICWRFAEERKKNRERDEGADVGVPDEDAAVQSDSERRETAKEAARVEKDAIRAAAADRRRQVQDEREAELDRLRARAGRSVVKKSFGRHTVEIFEKGYVSISGLFFAKASFEKLVAIEDSSDVQKKRAIGRGAGYVATGGMNMLGSNKRGDVYLTIVTDVTVHSLHVDPPTERDMRSAKALAAAGRAVLENRDSIGAKASAARPEVSRATSVSGDAAEIKALADLRDQGILTEEEFQAKKQQILGI